MRGIPVSVKGCAGELPRHNLARGAEQRFGGYHENNLKVGFNFTDRMLRHVLYHNK